MSELRDELLQLLQAAAAGEVAADDPRVLHAVATEPAFAARWQSLQATQRLLQAAAAEEAATLSAIGVQPATAAPKLHGTTAPARTPRSRPSWPLLAIAAAAAVAAAALWWTRERAPEPKFLGGNVPIGVVAADFATFRFDFELPPGGAFEVRVTAGDTTLLLVHRWQQQTWSPPANDRQRWPAQVRIDVVAVDAQGDEQGRGSALVTRTDGK